MENTEKKEMVVLTPFEQQKTELQKFVADYKELVVTKENLKESDEKRLVLYRKRIEIQRIAKANKDALNKAKKINDQREEELVAVIKPVEDDILAKVQAIENIEKNRIENHKTAINGVTRRITTVVSMSDLNSLVKLETDFEAWFKDYNAEEFALELAEAANGLRNAIANTKIAIQARLDSEAKLREEEAAAKKKLEQEALKVANTLFDDVPEQELAAKDESGLLEASGLDKALDIKIERDLPHETGVPYPNPMTPKEAFPSTPIASTEKAFKPNFHFEGYEFYIDQSLSEKSIEQIQNAIRTAILNNESF